MDILQQEEDLDVEGKAQNYIEGIKTKFEAKEIISKILYITIATSTKSGVPWNSPVYSAYDKNYNFYWISWRKNQHSKNIKDNNQIFICYLRQHGSCRTRSRCLYSS